MAQRDNVGTHLDTGQTAVGTSAVQLTEASRLLVQGVTIQADAGNSNVVYVGKEGVTTSNGFPLPAGSSVTITIDDASKVYVIGGAASQQANWLMI